MRWSPGGRSPNLEDRRGGGGPSLRVGGGIGIGGLLLLVILSLIFKQDFLSLVGAGGSVAPTGTGSAPVSDPNEEPQVQFVSFVLDDTQRTWQELLQREGTRYPEAQLVLFRNAVESACGFAQSASGPFYCPADQRVYIDLSFFEELHTRFGAPGDFAQAYVLAHEIGHHVQNVLGIERQVRGEQQANPRQRNELSVRMELQADCFAGVWGHSTQQRNILEEGDVDEGLGAASAVGDDRLQAGSGRINPDSFTHGTSEQRARWFRRGFSSGNPADCNTFAQP
ncbi:MAG: neutral zinc metallopeptidase [Candidatus Korobacteraceae bacterium]